MRRAFKFLIFLNLFVISLLIVLNVLRNFFNIYLYLEIEQNVIHYILFFTIIVLITVVLIFAIIIYKKVILTMILVLLMVIVIPILHFSLLSFAFREESKYMEITSPDGKKTIVVEQLSWLMGGHGNFYLKRNQVFMKKIGEYDTNDNPGAFDSEDEYEISWMEGSVVITYYWGKGEMKTIVKPFSLLFFHINISGLAGFCLS